MMFSRTAAVLAGIVMFSAGCADLSAQSQPVAIGPESGLKISSSANLAQRVNGLMYYGADDGVHGLEPWISDGTPEGTRLLVDTVAGPGGSVPVQFTGVGDSVYFKTATAGVQRLWRADVTTTSLVAELPGVQNLVFFCPSGDMLYFMARYGASTDVELWRSDGTEAGTVQLTSRSNFTLHPSLLAAAGAGVIFGGNDAASGVGSELYYVDNASTAVQLVKDINPGPLDGISASFQLAITIDGYGLFNADDGVHGSELWRSDGTAAGTVFMQDITPGPEGSRPLLSGPDPESWTKSTPHYFRDFDTNPSFWSTDGTPAGTFQIASFTSAPATATWSVGVLDDQVFFRGDSLEAGSEIWVSDGSEDSGMLLKDIYPGPLSSEPTFFMPGQSLCYFTASSPEHGEELWVTDGTAAGTRMLKDIQPGAGSSVPAWPVTFRDRVFFTADDGLNGRELWTSLGTPESTVMVTDMRPGAEGSEPKHLAKFGSRLVFHADTSETNGNLYAIETGVPAAAADWQLFQ